MADAIKIKLNIAGRHYPMSVSTEEEETVREAGKMINDMIKVFEQQYQTRDKQDALAMCSLQVAVKSLQLDKNKMQDNQDIDEQLQQLITNIQEAI